MSSGSWNWRSGRRQVEKISQAVAVPKYAQSDRQWIIVQNAVDKGNSIAFNAVFSRAGNEAYDHVVVAGQYYASRRTWNGERRAVKRRDLDEVREKKMGFAENEVDWLRNVGD
jgi:hypothetical protein